MFFMGWIKIMKASRGQGGRLRLCFFTLGVRTLSLTLQREKSRGEDSSLSVIGRSADVSVVFMVHTKLQENSAEDFFFFFFSPVSTD